MLHGVFQRALYPNERFLIARVNAPRFCRVHRAKKKKGNAWFTLCANITVDANVYIRSTSINLIPLRQPFAEMTRHMPQQVAGETEPTAPSRMKKLTNAVTVPADACKYFEQPKRLVLDCSSIKLERITSTHYPASSNGCSSSLRLLRLAYQRNASPTHAMNPITLATTTAACAAPVQHDHAHRASPSEHVCTTAGDADAMSDRMNAAATPALQPNPVCGTYSPPPPEAPLVAAEYFSNSVPFISQLRRAALKYLRRMLQKDREGRT